MYSYVTDDRGTVLSALSCMWKSGAEEAAATSLPLVLIGSRAAIHYDSNIRTPDQLKEHSDWDFIISLASLREVFSAHADLRDLRLVAISRYPLPVDILSLFSDDDMSLVDLSVTCSLPNGAKLEFEVVDPDSRKIQTESGANLLSLLHNHQNLAHVQTPIGSFPTFDSLHLDLLTSIDTGNVVLCPLQLLVALKESHALIHANWGKTISDLNHLASVPEQNVISRAALINFAALRNEEARLRESSTIELAGLRGLKPIRLIAGSLVGTDGELCLLSTTDSFRALSEQDKFDAAKLELLVQYLSVSDLDKKSADVPFHLVLSCLRAIATSPNYCEAGRRYVVAQNVALSAWLAEIPDIIADALYLLRKERESPTSTAQPTAQKAEQHRKIVRCGVSHIEIAWPLMALPADVLIEVLACASSHALAFRVGLCARGTWQAITQSSTGFWERLCRASFPKFMVDLPNLPQNLYEAANPVNWRRFFQGYCSARAGAQERIPKPSVTAGRVLQVVGIISGRNSEISRDQIESPEAHQLLEFLLNFTEVVRRSTSSKKEDYDDPAWRFYEVTLVLKLPTMRILKITVRAVAPSLSLFSDSTPPKLV